VNSLLQGAMSSSSVEHRSNLVLLIRFSDHASRNLPSKEDIATLMAASEITSENQHLIPTGSVGMFYEKQSRGQLLVGSTVTEWIDVPFSEAEASLGCRAMCLPSDGTQHPLHQAIRYAVQESAKIYDFTNFDLNLDGNIDGLTIIHSGYGAEWGGSGYMNRIWSHKWGFGYYKVEGTRE